jgi:hypothetical protein
MPYTLIPRRFHGGYILDHCPGCGQQHRHQTAGPQTSECGTAYTLIPSVIDHGQDDSLTRPGDPITAWATT